MFNFRLWTVCLLGLAASGCLHWDTVEDYRKFSDDDPGLSARHWSFGIGQGEDPNIMAEARGKMMADDRQEFLFQNMREGKISVDDYYSMSAALRAQAGPPKISHQVHNETADYWKLTISCSQGIVVQERLGPHEVKSYLLPEGMYTFQYDRADMVSRQVTKEVNSLSRQSAIRS